MNINIICVGKLKEKYWKDAVEEYSKRISRFAKVQITEVKESRISDNPSPAEEDRVRKEEGEEILRKIKPGDFCITLEIKGKMLDSEQLADKISDICLSGRSTIDFVIGGSIGISPEVSSRADFKLSFSKMTFPHQMMRVILLEQIYRAFKINNNETYHK